MPTAENTTAHSNHIGIAGTLHLLHTMCLTSSQLVLTSCTIGNLEQEVASRCVLLLMKLALFRDSCWMPWMTCFTAVILVSNRVITVILMITPIISHQIQEDYYP